MVDSKQGKARDGGGDGGGGMKKCPNMMSSGKWPLYFLFVTSFYLCQNCIIFNKQKYLQYLQNNIIHLAIKQIMSKQVLNRYQSYMENF